jgi:uncharacterized membrane protein
MRDGTHDAERPVTRAAGPYGHPIHPMLVPIPIGAWIASLVFDIGSHVVDRPAALVTGSRWLIAVGIVGAVLAAVFGLMDLLAIPRGTRAFATGLTHLALNTAIVAAFVISYLLRVGRPATGAVSVGLIVLSVAALVALAVSGYLGGELSYRFGVRVAGEDEQRRGFEPTNTATQRRRAA